MQVIIGGYSEATGITLMNGVYTVVGGYQSKDFKTEKGAKKWALKMGII